jgi:hypothetical protein
MVTYPLPVIPSRQPRLAATDNYLTNRLSGVLKLEAAEEAWFADQRIWAIIKSQRIKLARATSVCSAFRLISLPLIDEFISYIYSSRRWSR